MNDNASIAIRRAYPRMDVQVPVRIQHSGDEEPLSGVALNLSRSGALVRLDRPVVSGARYLVQFLEPGPFNIFGDEACQSCGAIPTPQAVPEQTVWARVLREGAGAKGAYAAAFEFESLLEVVEAEAA